MKDAVKFLQFLVKAFEGNVVEKNETAGGIVGHAKVGIDDSILECSEAHGEWGPRMATMHLYVPGTDVVYERALKAGATCLFEPKDRPYGERSGGLMDEWGNHWYVAICKESAAKEEVEKRVSAQGR